MSDHDDYLWNRGGRIDPELERMERLLGRLGRREPPPPLAFDIVVPIGRREWLPLAVLVTAAAAIVALSGAAWWARPKAVASGTFSVSRLEGAPLVGARALTSSSHLGAGEWLETPPGARATIDLAGIGRVDVDPESRVRAISMQPGDYRLSLGQGTLHAFIWAPPGQFFVETPSSVAIDLGCAYTLTVAANGDGLLRVTSGWVGFEWNGLESFIPAGAVGRTRTGRGPGTPYYEDSSERLQVALDDVDFGERNAGDLDAKLDIVLAEARPRDAVTLWHLLTRVSGDGRGRVFDRLAAFVPPGVDITREGILGGRRDMLDAWWNRLGLDTASWWRTWKQPWK